MPRIVAGVAGGRTIRAPQGDGTRPTSDRVREALFSRLDAMGAVDGARVLDLYAGSGALGLEAASRGAEQVVLVERDARAARIAAANAAALGFDQVSTVTRPVHGYLSGGASLLTDLVFADPPYALTEDELADVLALLVEGRWLADDAVVVVERSARTPEPAWPGGLEATGDRRYGETRLWFASPVPDSTAE